MKKAVTLIALASVAMSTEMGDIADHNLNFFKSIGNGLKKAGQFVVQHPQIITTAVKVLALEDENEFGLTDVELFNLKEFIKHAKKDIQKGAQFVKDHPAVVNDGVHIAKDIKTKDYKNLIHDGVQTLKDLGFDDEELFHFKDLIAHAKKDIEKGAHFVQEHPHIINDGIHIVKDIKSHQYKHLPDDVVQTLKDLGFEDEELFSFGKIFNSIKQGVGKGINWVKGHPEVIKDGVNIVKDVKGHNYGQLIKDGVKTFHDIKQHDDDELFNWKELIHDGIKTYDDVKVQPRNYGDILNDAIKIIKDIKQHDDDELFNIGHAIKKGAHLVKDGANIYKDVQTGNYGKLIKDGVKTVHDVKQHDDDELFNLGNAIKKGAHLVKDGVNIVKDVKTGNIPQLIKDGVKTVHDVKQHDDDELFNIGHAIKNGINYVKGHPEVVKDGVNIVKDVKGHNYGQLIKDGVKTFHDIKQHDDDELFNLGNAIKKGAHLVKDGVNIVKDVKTGNIPQLIKDGVKTVHDVKQHDDDEFFNVKDFVHHVEKDVNKGVHFVQAHPAVINDAVHIVKDVKDKKVGDLIHDGVKIFKDLGFEDQTDNSLFSLKDLIHDGINIAHDVKSHNYGDLVNHGIQTVKDIKNKDKKFLF